MVVRFFESMYPSIPDRDFLPSFPAEPDSVFSKAFLKRCFVAPTLIPPLLSSFARRHPVLIRTWCLHSDTTLQKIMKVVFAVFLLVPLWAYLFCDRAKPSKVNEEQLKPIPEAFVDKIREGTSLGELFSFTKNIPIFRSVRDAKFTVSQVAKGIEIMGVMVAAHVVLGLVGNKIINASSRHLGDTSKIAGMVRFFFRPLARISLPSFPLMVPKNNQCLSESICPSETFLSLVKEEGATFVEKKIRTIESLFSWVQGKSKFPFALSVSDNFLRKVRFSVRGCPLQRMGVIKSKHIDRIRKGSWIGNSLVGVVALANLFFANGISFFILGNFKPFPSTKLSPWKMKKISILQRPVNLAVAGLNGYISLWQKWVVLPFLQYGPWSVLTMSPIESIVSNLIQKPLETKSLFERIVVKLCG
ncbi:MAG: hypothetical protein WCP39_01280 [Chlamydiota bacterium]